MNPNLIDGNPMSLPAKEFSNRRRALMERMAPNSIAILASAPVRIRNRDVDYLYRQESDFHYLSGFVEPESVLVLLPAVGSSSPLPFGLTPFLAAACGFSSGSSRVLRPASRGIETML